MTYIKSYVIHVKGNKERELYIKKELKRHNVVFEFMLDGNIEDISNELLNKYFSGDMKIASSATSCALKHFLVYEKMLKDNADYALIFEDDIKLFDSFGKIYEKSLREINELKEGILISYENSTQSYVKKSEIVPDKVLYPKNHGRCTGAYLIDKVTAKNILEYTYKYKCNLPIDWFHTKLTKMELMQIYWCEPPIAEQNSHNGKFKSLIGNPKYGLLRQAYYKLKKLYKYQVVSRFK